MAAMEINSGLRGSCTSYHAKCYTNSERKLYAEKERAGFSSVNSYSKYLQGKYSYMNTGTTSMQGIPTTISVSGVFLQKCMNDPEKAKYLEENLAAIPDCVKSLANFTKTMAGSPVCTYATYIIGDDGNITCMSGCTNDPDGKIARENAERMAKEKRDKQEKIREKRADERARRNKTEEKNAAKQRAETEAWEIGRTEIINVTEKRLKIMQNEYLYDTGNSVSGGRFNAYG